MEGGELRGGAHNVVGRVPSRGAGLQRIYNASKRVLFFRRFDPTKVPGLYFNLTSVRPIFGAANEAGAYWVLTNIGPLFGFGFRAAQDVIEKARLPSEFALADDRFQCLDPFTERYCAVALPRKQMQVIWHQYVSACVPAVARWAAGDEINQATMNNIVGQHRLAVLNADR